ncbi:MAG: DUF3726 domain-containing protein [Candidatus Promineifilaceae bacterium]
MIVSHNEILITCQKALEARGFSQGVREDAADSIAWLEQLGFSVLPNLCAVIEQLQPVNDGWELQADPPNHFELHANGGSCLQFGSLAADFALSKAQELGYSTGDVQGSEIDLWVGYLRQAASVGINCYAVWQIGTQMHQLHFAAYEALPNYVCQQLDESADEETIRISLSKQPLPIAQDEQTPPVFLVQTNSAEFATKRQHHLINGITVDDNCWTHLKKVAKGILVEDTEESRARGAGGA